MLHTLILSLGTRNVYDIFISVSSAGDTESAPPGHRAVMVSTHCDLDEWEGLDPEAYRKQKARAGERLVALARRVYPELGRAAVVYEVATPRTYERFTGRPRGAVGGVRQTLGNSNQRAVPHDVGVPGLWLAGDTTWPGLGTVACVLGSRLVAEAVLASAPRRPAHCPPADADVGPLRPGFVTTSPAGAGAHRPAGRRRPAPAPARRPGHGPAGHHQPAAVAGLRPALRRAGRLRRRRLAGLVVGHPGHRLPGLRRRRDGDARRGAWVARARPTADG